MSIRKERKRILFVCSGNTCRSSMGKIILKQKLTELGQLDRFEIDSAAFGNPTYDVASEYARAAIKEIYGQDLLANHKTKKVTTELTEQADIILAMTGSIKNGLPQEKSWTLKEYADSSGDISDPYGKPPEKYLECAYEISDLMDSVVEKLG